MTLPRSVSDVLTDHVRFEIESIDRMYLNVFVSQLQRTGQVAGFLMRHRGFPIASTALVAPMSKGFVSDIYDFATAHEVPLVRFAKGQRKDDVMRDHLSGFTGTTRSCSSAWRRRRPTSSAPSGDTIRSPVRRIRGS